MPNVATPATARCLIVERHPWETGFGQEQLQIPLRPAEEFFGADATKRNSRPHCRRRPTPISMCGLEEASTEWHTSN